MSSPTTQSDDQWIEIFHSKPSMRRCFLIEKLSSGEYSKPSSSNMLVDASHIREGFRVYRTKARRIEFVLTNGTNRHWQDDNGKNYILDAIPGRYVVEHGIRRVGDADVSSCRQAVLRPNDCHMHLVFRADLWENCYCSYKVDDQDWTVAPGKQMIQGTGPSNDDTPPPEQEGKYFYIVIKGHRLECAFNDGGENWDSKLGFNYKLGLPGRYHVYDGQVIYVKPAHTDVNATNQHAFSEHTMATKSIPLVKNISTSVGNGVPQPSI